MGRPLRVVLDARIPDGVSGGVQQWIIGLASALSSLGGKSEEYWFLVDGRSASWLAPFVRRPCRLLHVGSPASGQDARAATGKLWNVGARLVEILAFLRSLAGRIGRRLHWPFGPISAADLNGSRVDVLHFPSQAAFESARPSIYQPWDLQHVHLPEFFTEAGREERDRMYRRFCEQAALVIAPSTWVKRDLVDQYAIPEARIAVVNVPPVTVAYPVPSAPETNTISERLQLPERFVFYPAQTWAHKNHGRLFEALKILHDRGLSVPLVCSGHRNERYPELIDAVRRLGLDSRVQFLGFLKPLEIQALYRRARALVFPSLYEGWGLPIVEAFANDLPVACSNVTSLPELVGDAAILFDPYDAQAIAAAVERIWTDDVLAAQLVARGKATLDRFDWHRTALIMRAHYRTVAGKALGRDELALLAATPSV